MPLGAFRLNTLGRNLVAGGLVEGAGSTPGSTTYTYTFGTTNTSTTSVGYWKPDAGYAITMAESSGNASNPGFHVTYSIGTTLYRRLYYRSGTGTGTTVTLGTQTSMITSFTPDEFIGISPQKLSRDGGNGRGRFIGKSASNLRRQYYVWHTSSTGVSSAAYLTDTTTLDFFGHNHCGRSGTIYYHNWYANSTATQYNCIIDSCPNDFTTAYTNITTLSSSTGNDYAYLTSQSNSAVQGLGNPANTYGISFLYTYGNASNTQNNGNDALIITNGYVFKEEQTPFNFGTSGRLLSMTMSRSNNIGIIGWWNSSTQKLDMRMFSVSCPDTSTINVTWGTHFTLNMSGEQNPQFGRSGRDGRIMLTSTNGSSTVYVRTLDSSDENTLTVSNRASSTGYTAAGINHACFNRFPDANDLDNTLGLFVLDGTTLKVRFINRA